jgi:NAD(P) transhydrogenase subunit alpha
MIVGVPKELYPGERRVAMIPNVVKTLKKKGFEVIIEEGAGYDAGYPDDGYKAQGATVASRSEVFEKADVIAMIRGYGSGSEDDENKDDLNNLREGQVVMALTDPLGNPQAAKEYADCPGGRSRPSQPVLRGGCSDRPCFRRPRSQNRSRESSR